MNKAKLWALISVVVVLFKAFGIIQGGWLVAMGLGLALFMPVFSELGTKEDPTPTNKTGVWLLFTGITIILISVYVPTYVTLGIGSAGGMSAFWGYIFNRMLTFEVILLFSGLALLVGWAYLRLVNSYVNNPRIRKTIKTYYKPA